MSRQIDCIALDLDRTTLGSSGTLSPENRAAIEAAIAAGVHVVIASGRSYSALPEEVLKIPGVDYLITSNGAAVHSAALGKCVLSHKLSPESVESILALTAALPVTYEAFLDGVPYAGAAYIEDPVRFGASEHSRNYVKRTRRPVEDIALFIEKNSEKLDCIDVIIQDPAAKEQLHERLLLGVPDVYITTSMPYLLEISHKDAGKKAGLAFVLERLGISPCRAAAFGDADNDSEMLAFVGHGIAVANASPGCKAAAKRVTASGDENGVAIAIWELLSGA